MEKKVHFKLHKVKKHWVTIAVTGLTLGLSFAGLNYASAEEQPTPVNEATVEAIIKEGAIDVEAPASNEATAKPKKTQLLPLRVKLPQHQKRQWPALKLLQQKLFLKNQALKSQAQLVRKQPARKLCILR